VSSLDDLTGGGLREFAVGAPGTSTVNGEVVVYSLDGSASTAFIAYGQGCAPAAAGTGRIEPLIGLPAALPRGTSGSFAIGLCRAPVGVRAYLFLGLRKFAPAVDLGQIFPQLVGCFLYPDTLTPAPGISLPPVQTQPLDPRNTSLLQGWAEYPMPFNLREPPCWRRSGSSFAGTAADPRRDDQSRDALTVEAGHRSRSTAATASGSPDATRCQRSASSSASPRRCRCSAASSR
jgi:hypothetical protein